MHAISSYHGNRPTRTHPQTHRQAHRQDRLQYTAPLSLARSVTRSTRRPQIYADPTKFLQLPVAYERKNYLGL